MNKSLATNIFAAVLMIVGYLVKDHQPVVFSVGAFALSGSLTNWLAVHMLFEKVPFLYGSGVIVSRFEDFKSSIKTLIIQEFFAHQHVEKFLAQNSKGLGGSMVAKVDFDRVFNGLMDAIEGSSLGGMLSLVGGRDALEPLRDPVTKKLEDIISDLAKGEVGDGVGQDITGGMISKVEDLIDARLNELTPEMVKEIVQDMIRAHLGWLVVWGGVFGGVIGLVYGITGL